MVMRWIVDAIRGGGVVTEEQQKRMEAVARDGGHAADARLDPSPDGRSLLVVESHTDLSESGPITYSHTDLRLCVYDVPSGKRLLEHKASRSWDDSASRTELGLQNWRLTNSTLELEYVDRNEVLRLR
jgi:hypothetical protein